MKSSQATASLFDADNGVMLAHEVQRGGAVDGTNAGLFDGGAEVSPQRQTHMARVDDGGAEGLLAANGETILQQRGKPAGSDDCVNAGQLFPHPSQGVLSESTDGDVAYAYDSSLEGFLTCIFTAFERRQDPFDIVESGSMQIPLFATVLEVQTDEQKAKRVLDGISKRIGRDEAQLVKLAFLNDDPKRGVKILRYLQLAMRSGRSVYEDHANPVVADYEKLWRQVSTERHRMLQFLRFRELEGGVFFAKINPKANVVPAIMHHFSRRFNTQPFIIYDEVHHIAGVSNGGEWSLVLADSLNLPQQTQREDAYNSMWRTFYNSIGNKERLNPGLRVHWMPKRLWSNITEMVSPLDA